MKKIGIVGTGIMSSGMANAFRSAFYVSLVATLVTLPAVLVGFFPITLLMGSLSLLCFVLWTIMRSACSDASSEDTSAPSVYIQPVDESTIVTSDNSQKNSIR